MAGSNRFSLNNAICSVAEREDNKKLKWWQMGKCNWNKWILVFFIISIILLIVSVGVYVGQTDKQWTTSSSTVGIVFGALFTVLLGGWFIYNNGPEKYAIYNIEEGDIEGLKSIKMKLKNNHEQLDKYNSKLTKMNMKIKAQQTKQKAANKFFGEPKDKLKTKIENIDGKGFDVKLPKLNINSSNIPSMPNIKSYMPNIKNPIHIDSLEKRLADREELKKTIKELKDEINKDEIKFEKLKLLNNKYNSIINLESQILKDLLKFEESYSKEEAKKIYEIYKDTNEKLTSLDNIITGESILVEYEKLKIEQSVKIISSIFNNVLKIMPEYLESKERLESDLTNEKFNLDVDNYIKNIEYKTNIDNINKSGHIKKYNLFNISNDIGETIKLFEDKFDVFFKDRYSKLDLINDVKSLINARNDIDREYEIISVFSIPFINKYYDYYKQLADERLSKIKEDEYKKENDNRVGELGNMMDKVGSIFKF